MYDFIEAIIRGIKGAFRALHPRNLKKMAADIPLYAPLAVRSVRRRLVRYLLVGLCLGAGIVVFLGLSASFRGTAATLAGQTRDIELPADVLAFGTDVEGSEPVSSLGWVSQAGDYEAFERWEGATSLGTRPVVGLAEGGRLWTAAVGEGGLAPGEAAVPRVLAEAGGIVPGDEISIGQVGPDGFRGSAFKVAILTDDAGDFLLGEAIVVNLQDLLDLEVALDPYAAGEATAVAAWERDPGDRDRLLGRVRDLFPGAMVWWPGMASEQALKAAGGFLSPGNIVLALVFVMAGLGVFNVMLLTLLQRKSQLGVLKALGAVDDEVFLLLLLEGSLTGLAGTVFGLVGGIALVKFLDRASLVPLSLSISSMVWAVILALISFFLAAWLPATLCRRARVGQLMAGRRLYLNPRSTCAQCGRCGGF